MNAGKTLMMALLGCTVMVSAAQAVKIGLNYPKTGPYSVQGLDQWRAANLAVSQINAGGGILGEQVELVWKDSQSRADLSRQNATDLITKDGVKMIFGGSSSGVAVAVGEVCEQYKVPFFGTLTYSNETTDTKAHRHTFRECYDSWSAAKVLADYMNQNFSGKSYAYITADYTWGHSTEESFRKFTRTEDKAAHKGVKTPFPGATEADFKKALSFAKMIKPDVLVLVLFGDDMVNAVRLATSMGLKTQMQIVVPNLTLGMAEGGGPKVMEGVVGAVPWCWQVPFAKNYPQGKEFVNSYAAEYGRYPSSSGGSAYTILFQYKLAVERAGSFDDKGVIEQLEGHAYTMLKDQQVWRDFDHQSIQTVYAVRCKPEAEVLKDKFKLDYFEIIATMNGSKAFKTRAEWDATRKAAGLPTSLEALN